MFGRNVLLVDSFSEPLNIVLNESNSNGLVKFRGKFQEADAVNKNKRIYPRKVLEENVEKLQDAIKKRELVGELDHPSDSVIHFANVSHLVNKLWWEGNILMGEGEILNTPSGKILKALLNDGVRIGMSSRGVGSGTTNENGVLLVDNISIITWDCVSQPSCYNAFQEKVVKGENIDNYFKNSVKNESVNVNKVNKDLLIAALGGIIQEQANKVKTNI